MPKKLLFLFLVLLLSWGSGVYGQVKITEIMYNDPSGGTSGDSLEYVEITNNGGTLLNLLGYQFTAGITFTFPSTLLFPGGFVVIAKNSNACNNFFTLTGTLQWDAGQSLANQNGEAVVIKNATGVVEDSVRYYPTSPWPTAANGLGSSIQRCNPSAPSNDATSWAATAFANAVAYGTIGGVQVYATPGQGCTSLPPYTPSYATLPFSENFDGTWIVANDQRDVPSNNWKNDPATGNPSWRRADDGAAAAWTNPANGAYTPVGANGSNFSARFHTAGTMSGYQGNLMAYLNFNTTGLKVLSFWYINTAGTDSLSILISDNGGITFNKIQTFFTTVGWEQKQVILGPSTAPSTILKFQATSNNTANDIGLDEVAVTIASDYDAGISAITGPNNMVFGATQNALVTLTNYGNLALTSVDIGWTVNGVAGATYPWAGNLVSGAQATGIDLGPFTITPLSLASIKAWTSNPNGNPDGNTNNDTANKSVYYQSFTSLPYNQDFENTWIDKFATHDVPDNYWNGVPSAGNASWRRDDDGTSAGWTALTTGAYTPAGALSTAHSARFHTSGNPALTVGIMDLYLDFSSITGNKELRFYHINSAGNDSVALWISQDAGQTFTYLTKYTTAAAWTIRTVPLGNISSSTVVLRFKATSNSGGNTDPGIDQVSVDMPQPEMTMLSILRPNSGCTLTATEMVRIKVKNTGSMALDSIPVFYDLDGTQVDEMILSTMQPGDTVTYTFTTPADFSAPGSHQLSAMVHYPGDYLPNNDSLARTITNIVPINTFPFNEGFENGGTMYFNLTSGTNAHINVEPGIGNVGSYGLHMDGNVAGTWPSGSGNSTTAAQAWGTYTDHQAFAVSCSVDGAQLVHPILKLDLKQTYINGGGPRYSWFRVLINDTVVLSNGQNVSEFNPLTNNADPFVTQIFDLGPYANTQFKLTLQSSCKFDDANAGGVGDNVFVDNVTISEKPPVNLAVNAWVSPAAGCGMGSAEQVVITIENLGGAAVSDIPVAFSIDGGLTWVQDTITGPLAINNTLNYTFSVTADFSAAGVYPCIVYASKDGDYDTGNDTLTTTLSNYFPINTFPFTEDFETGTSPYFRMTAAANSHIQVQPAIGNGGSYGVKMDGNVAGTWTAGSGNSTTAAQAWGTYTDHQAKAVTCVVDATSLAHPVLRLDLKQTYISSGGPLYSWFRVLVNDTVVIFNSNFASNFNPVTPTADPFITQVFNLTTYAHSQFTVTLQSSCKYNDANSTTGSGDNVFIDNFEILESTGIDISPTSWISPQSGCGLTNAEPIVVIFHNLGATNTTSIPVGLSTDGGLTWQTDTFSGPIAPGSGLAFAFPQLVDFSATGTYNCLVYASVPGDMFTNNDTLHFTVLNQPQVVLGTNYLQDFENGNGGWMSGALTGIDDWALGTPAKPTINTAHSGTNAYVTGLTQNYSSNANSYVQSPCLDFSSMTNPYLSVWLYLRTENNNDAMIMEVMVNDSAWYKPAVLTGFYNNNSNNGPLPAPKWSGLVNGWQKFTTSVPDLAGEANVKIRFRFASNATTVNEGIAIDDIEIFEPYPDIAMTSIDGPMSGCSLSATEMVIITVQNAGLIDVTDIPVSYTLDGGTAVNEIIPITLNPGNSYSYAFIATADLSAQGTHDITASAQVTGDLNTTNNQAQKYVYTLNDIVAPSITDFEAPGYYDYWVPASAANSAYAVTTGNGYNGSTGFMMQGGAAGTWPGGSGNNTTAAQAFSYTEHIASLSTCDVTIPTTNQVRLWLQLRQTYSTGPRYSFFRVMLNDTVQLTDINGVTDYNPTTPDADTFSLKAFDLTPYAPTLQLSLQASCKYSETLSSTGIPDAAYVDNIEIGIYTSMNPGVNEEPRLVLYPNPAGDFVNILLKQAFAQSRMEVFDAEGRLVMQKNMAVGQNMQLDISELPEGVYALRVIDGDFSQTLRFVRVK